jgi:hypothetical protein
LIRAQHWDLEKPVLKEPLEGEECGKDGAKDDEHDEAHPTRQAQMKDQSGERRSSD